MENQVITVVPAEGTLQPTQPLPVAVAEKPRRLRRSPVDSSGREKRFVFVRRMNSAALALFADTLITLLTLVGSMLILFLIMGLYSVFSLDILMDMASGEGSSSLDSASMLLVQIAMALSMPAGHMIPAYMHSVRNGFSVMSTLKPGKRLGLTLPAAIIAAVGFTYAWVFIYAICGHLMPDSFFGNSNVFGSAFTGMDLPSMIVSGVTTGILVPIAEEFLFRGALLKSFSRYGTGFAVTASALLFGIMHGNMFQTPFATIAGVIMAYVAIRSGSIWPSIIIHMCINSFSVIHSALLVLLPASTGVIDYIFYGFTGLCILATIIILCTCSGKISWKPIDPASNNVLLPKVDTKVRCKLLRFFLSFGIMVFMVMFTLTILVDCGVDFGMGEYTSNYMYGLS